MVAKIIVLEPGVRKVWNCPIALLGQIKIFQQKASIMKGFSFWENA